MNFFRKCSALAVIGMTACVLAACGGGGNGVLDGGGLGDGSGGSSGGGSGGGGAATPSAPTLTLMPQSTKVLHFSWASVSGATHYVLLEDPDGASGFKPATDDDLPAAASTYDHVIFLPARVNARYVLQACNAAGCADSAAVSVPSQLTAAIGYVKASAQELDGDFGSSVALSADGLTMAVGMPAEDSDATGVGTGGDSGNELANASGAVYVFARSGDIWLQQAYVKASNTGAGDQFGKEVALSGDGHVLAVSAIGESGNGTGTTGDPGNDGAPGSGAVYVFRRGASAWTQEAYVKASNTGANDGFGRSLALSADGTTLAVGANAEDSSATGINGDQADNSAVDSGAVYVFALFGNVWAQQGYLKASNASAGDRFGSSLALSADGGTLAVGAHQEDSNATGINGDQSNNSATDSGATYVFTRSNGNWSQQAYLKGSNTETGDAFGASVALSADGNTLVASAPFEDSNATGIDGDQSNNAAGVSGAVYVFTRSGGGWALQAYVKASNTQALDRFGYKIALSPEGNTLAVSAIWEDSSATGLNGNQADDSAVNSGALYLFVRRGDQWTQQAYVKAPNADAGDQFGGGNGTGLGSVLTGGLALGGQDSAPTLAVGVPNEASSATGINGNQADNSLRSGAVYLY
ncbi:FG-GAP repeat protein [Hydrogenophaga intermedia]|uniref:Integrin alpha beta-propellor repeat protein n=2 Tax=Hydrogenophaga intermedia TaxID=65786 RepID=A0A1L1PCP4_HYDIT|nr:FG-GAP repeat protein [Hydrogenophaga intermedia]TMU73841.1 integrin [Hydrogenophaga intermedia]CDN87738.1 Integrin alpha beta-propellor repeat protein [Hydrogenophaga intermedia]